MIGADLGVDADIGGVGIAMILLILGSDALQRRGLMKAPTESGITFWGQMYVPIVVASCHVTRWGKVTKSTVRA